MPKTTVQMVDEFAEAFGIDRPKKAGWPEDTLPSDRATLKELAEMAREVSKFAHTAAKARKSTVLLRAHLMAEELAELMEAMSLNDLSQVLHEGADLRYVVDGTMLAFGLGKVYEKGVAEIHRANMSKLENGKAIRDGAGRVLKGKNFRKADVRPLLKKA